jgi:hypothetical protein
VGKNKKSCNQNNFKFAVCSVVFRALRVADIQQYGNGRNIQKKVESIGEMSF